MTEIVTKLRAARERLIEKDREVVIERFAEYIYRNVEPNVRGRGSLAVFTRASEMDALFDGTDEAAREWLIDTLRREKLIKTASDGSGTILLTHEGAERLCL